jgi:hypothetical protein
MESWMLANRRRRGSSALWVAVLAFALVGVVSACGSPPTEVANTSAQPEADSAGTVWLCRPGQGSDPCTASLDTTVVEPDGASHVVDYQVAKDPAIDCFYVYPGISYQRTPNANLHVDPQETAIAQLEASPFSQDCRVFAPMYRSYTDTATGTAAVRLAYDSVLGAWRDYLAHYNDGRGIVLIGHSEGSYLLTQLLTDEIDQVPAVRKLLVSAIITGVNDPTYVTGFGPLKTIGPCESPSQFGCVVDYNAYNAEPPSDAQFGEPLQPEIDGHAVEDICTNPANLSGGSGPLISMYRTQLATQNVGGSTTDGIFGKHPPSASTPWIEYDGGYKAQCVTSNGHQVLLVTSSGRVPPLTTGNPARGLHVDDPNLAMGNLVKLVRSQAAAYAASQP